MPNPFHRYQEIDSILRQALETREAERLDVVHELCANDQELLEQVRDLLGEIGRGGTLDPALGTSTAFLERELSESMIGTSLSHYQITAKLGAGGMGEVYRATDTKLGRDVALKVLPGSFAQDPERLSRFEREAKLLAALNHPNIAQVYGFEEHDGTHFLIMELAEGQTLADRIRRGPIPLEETIAIARQVAEALEAAHEQGIVHRDLKPANVNVSAETSSAPAVKVLDFGLAKLMASPSDSGLDLTNSPTLTQPTAAGVLMGTAAYMSPEQARGQEADARSDIWAFGCVLYEMLTGMRAFGGENVSDILAAVLKEEPDYGLLPDSLWAGRLVRRCLSKDPRRRWHHIADVRVELEESQDQLDEAIPHVSSASSRKPWLIPLVMLGGLAAGFVLANALGQPTTPEDARDTYRVALDAPLPGGVLAMHTNSVSISADGKRLAVAGQGPGGGRIFVREAADEEWRALPNTERGSEPKLSPDGSWILFNKGHSVGQHLRTPFEGGATESMGASTGRPTGWHTDSRVLFVDDGALVAAAPNRQSEVLFECQKDGPECGTIAAITPLSEGAAVLCTQPVSNPQLLLWQRDLGFSPLYEDACQPKVIGSTLLFVRRGEIWAVRLGDESLPTGESIPTGVRTYIADRWASAHFDVASNGTLLYLDPIPKADLFRVDSRGRLIERVPLDRTIGGSGPLLIDVSPNGEHALVRSGGEVEVVRLGDGLISRPIEGDDTAWVGNKTFLSSRTNVNQLQLWDLQGSALQTIPLRGSDGQPFFNRVNTAAQRTSVALLHAPLPETSSAALIKAGFGENPTLEVWHDSPGFDRFPTLSPNERWLAWESDSSAGRMEVNVSRWQEIASPFPISTEGGSLPRWSKDSRTLFFFDADRTHLMAADVVDENEGTFTAPRRAFPLPERTVVAQRVAYDTLPNGEFLFAIAEREMRHRLVFNWLTEVEQRLELANR